MAAIVFRLQYLNQLYQAHTLRLSGTQNNGTSVMNRIVPSLTIVTTLAAKSIMAFCIWGKFKTNFCKSCSILICA